MEKTESNTWYCHVCDHYHFIGIGCPKVKKSEARKRIEDLFNSPNLKVSDMVNNPAHYKIPGLEVEALEVIRGVLTREEYIGYLRGNILKYQIRANQKGGEEDLQKSIVYSTELEIFLRDSS